MMHDNEENKSLAQPKYQAVASSLIEQVAKGAALDVSRAQNSNGGMDESRRRSNRRWAASSTKPILGELDVSKSAAPTHSLPRKSKSLGDKVLIRKTSEDTAEKKRSPKAPKSSRRASIASTAHEKPTNKKEKHSSLKRAAMKRCKTHDGSSEKMAAFRRSNTMDVASTKRASMSVVLASGKRSSLREAVKRAKSHDATTDGHLTIPALKSASAHCLDTNSRRKEKLSSLAFAMAKSHHDQPSAQKKNAEGEKAATSQKAIISVEDILKAAKQNQNSKSIEPKTSRSQSKSRTRTKSQTKLTSSRHRSASLKRCQTLTDKSERTAQPPNTRGKRTRRRASIAGNGASSMDASNTGRKKSLPRRASTMDDSTSNTTKRALPRRANTMDGSTTNNHERGSYSLKSKSPTGFKVRQRKYKDAADPIFSSDRRGFNARSTAAKDPDAMMCQSECVQSARRSTVAAQPETPLVPNKKQMSSKSERVMDARRSSPSGVNELTQLSESDTLRNSSATAREAQRGTEGSRKFSRRASCGVDLSVSCQSATVVRRSTRANRSSMNGSMANGSVRRKTASASVSGFQLRQALKKDPNQPTLPNDLDNKEEDNSEAAKEEQKPQGQQKISKLDQLAQRSLHSAASSRHLNSSSHHASFTSFNRDANDSFTLNDSILSLNTHGLLGGKPEKPRLRAADLQASFSESLSSMTSAGTRGSNAVVLPPMVSGAPKPSTRAGRRASMPSSTAVMMPVQEHKNKPSRRSSLPRSNDLFHAKAARKAKSCDLDSDSEDEFAFYDEEDLMDSSFPVAA